jgi:hypothetical protein
MREFINLMEALAHEEAIKMDAVLEHIHKAREGLKAWRTKHHLTLAGMSHGEYDTHPIIVLGQALNTAEHALTDFLSMDPAISHPEKSGARPDLTISHGVVVGNKHMVQANTSAGRTFMKEHFNDDSIATVGEIALQNLLKAAEFSNISVRHID